MAAGIGKRLQPLTFKTPKPLIRVNGTPMIESVIDALHKNGITDITIVTGHLAYQFGYLTQKDSNIRLIYNPHYETCNNISSLYMARDYIEDAIILDGDQIISNPAILHKEFTRSGYSAVWCEGDTDEWLMTVDGDNTVTNCSRTGGSHGWQLFSVSRWTAEDARKLKEQITTEFQKGNKDIYWDDVPMFCYPDEYDLTVYPMEYSDIREIDSIEDLNNANNYKEV